ncbi:hypothetical protein [Flavobacterium phage FL-1]|nr:hypothetical protein [Flavobacterium phage FL-1]
MTEKLIQKALLRFFSSHKYVFTNTYFFSNESDFLSFLSSGFCYECEIKISRSDFKADFKKEKHAIHLSKEAGKNLFLRKTNQEISTNLSWDFCRYFPELITSTEYSEYGRINGEMTKIRYHAQISSGVDFYSNDNELLPNKFFYVVPTGLISKEEVPEYAGLIYVDELGRCEKIKDGKFLHKDKLKVEKLFNKMYYSYERELINKLKN